MRCPKCGAEFTSQTNFCPNCGHNLVKTASRIENKKEVLPLEILLASIWKYKYWTLGVLVAIIVSFVGYHFYQENLEKEKDAKELVDYAMSVVKISGTYISTDGETTLDLDIYNKVSLRHNGRYYKGYWKEQRNGSIELNFSESVKYYGLYSSYSDYEYHSTLYLYDNKIWPSMSALMSYDTNKVIYVSKD